MAYAQIPVVHKTPSSADSAVFLDFCLQIEKTLKKFFVIERTWKTIAKVLKVVLNFCLHLWRP